MAKKITNRSILGQRGVNLIEEYVLAMGFAWHPTNQSVEAGIDGHIELRNSDSEQALNLVVAVQSKACTVFPSESETTVTYYCKEDDIEYWLSGNLPVMLIVSRPDTKEAYWVNISQHFQGQGNRSSKKVVFDKSRDQFDANVRARLFDNARPRDSGLYLAPLPKPELLTPNLLPVHFKGDSVFRVRSKFTDPKRVIDTFREADVRPERDWAMRGGEVLSFQQLNDDSWNSDFTHLMSPLRTQKNLASEMETCDGLRKSIPGVWFHFQAVLNNANCAVPVRRATRLTRFMGASGSRPFDTM